MPSGLRPALLSSAREKPEAAARAAVGEQERVRISGHCPTLVLRGWSDTRRRLYPTINSFRTAADHHAPKGVESGFAKYKRLPGKRRRLRRRLTGALARRSSHLVFAVAVRGSGRHVCRAGVREALAELCPALLFERVPKTELFRIWDCSARLLPSRVSVRSFQRATCSRRRVVRQGVFITPAERSTSGVTKLPLACRPVAVSSIAETITRRQTCAKPTSSPQPARLSRFWRS